MDATSSFPGSPSATKDFAAELQLLATARAARPTPLIDETIALVPNAYAAMAYARAGRIFEDTALVARAEKILESLRETHCNGGPAPVFRNTLGDRKGPPAIADDYAALIAAYLELHRTTKDQKWLEEATLVQEAETENSTTRMHAASLPKRLMTIFS